MGTVPRVCDMRIRPSQPYIPVPTLYQPCTQVLHSEIALLRSELGQEKERVSEKSRQNLRLQQLYNQTRRAFLDVPQLSQLQQGHAMVSSAQLMLPAHRAGNRDKKADRQ